METRTRFQCRRLGLIDVSLEEDSFIASSSGNLLDSNNSADQENVELLESITGNKLEDIAGSHEYGELGCQPSKYLEINSIKTTNKYNLRQSLAWDSDFFTGPGFLEPEELSSIMASGGKSEKHGFKLPRNQEDINRCRDSRSTLNDSLERLEADLFEDVRASIQKSHCKVSNAKASVKRLPEASQSRIGRASKKMDMDDHGKMKLKSASKNSSPISQVSVRTTKNPSSQQLSQKSVAKSKDQSLSKQTKVLQKACPASISSNRDSLGDLHMKSEKDNSRRITAGRVVSVSKTPVVGGSQITMSKRTVLANSSLGSSPATKTRSSTSVSLTGKIGKGDNNSSKRQNDSASNIPHSSSSIVKTQLRFASRNKMKSEKSNLSSCLKSASKLSPCSSPASSTGEWSSESAASTSTVTQRSSTSSTCLGNGSSQKVSSDTKTPKFSYSQNLVKKKNMEGKRKQITGYNSQSGNDASTGIVKPSGLRLPSPKIGFFDGAKPLTRTPRVTLQSHAVIPGGLTKTGGRSISSNGRQNKEKVAKPHPARSVVAVRATGSDNQKPSGTVKPKSPTRNAKSVAKTSLSSEDNRSGETSLEVQNESSLGMVAGTSKSEGILVVGHNNDMLDPSKHKIHLKDKEGASNGERCYSQKPESTSSICVTTGSTSLGNGLLSDQPYLLNGKTDQQNHFQISVNRLMGRFEALGDKSSPGGLIDPIHQGNMASKIEKINLKYR